MADINSVAGFGVKILDFHQGENWIAFCLADRTKPRDFNRCQSLWGWQYLDPERRIVTTDPDTPLRLRDAVRLAFPNGGMTVAGLRRERTEDRW